MIIKNYFIPPPYSRNGEKRVSKKTGETNRQSKAGKRPIPGTIWLLD